MPKSQRKKWRENFDKHEKNRENPQGNLMKPLLSTNSQQLVYGNLLFTNDLTLRISHF